MSALVPVLCSLICAALLATVALAGCGGGGGDDVAERAAAQRASAERYAGQMTAVSGEVQAAIAETAGTAEFTGGAAAAAATAAYAAAITAGAERLQAIKPPGAVRAQHLGLIALYKETATHLGTLGKRFGEGGDDPNVIAAVAQDLATELQTLATREAALRAQLDAGLAQLAGVAPSTPQPPSSPAVESSTPLAPSSPAG